MSVVKQLQSCSWQKVGSNSWYSLSCCKKLVHVGASLLSNQWNGAKNYESVKVSGTEFKVISLYKQTSKPTNELNEDISRILPKFWRIRIVHKLNGVLYCSCKHFERIGIMCWHIANVLQSIPGYKEPSHRDCAIRWWCDYMYYNTCSGMSLEQNMKSKSDDGMINLFSLFNCLETSDIKGPVCDSNLWVSVPIPRTIPTRF